MQSDDRSKNEKMMMEEVMPIWVGSIPPQELKRILTSSKNKQLTIRNLLSRYYRMLGLDDVILTPLEESLIMVRIMWYYGKYNRKQKERKK